MAQPIRWSPRAARQIENICDYIGQDSPYYAGRFAQSVLRLIKSIPRNPRLGRMVPECDDPLLRERILGGYRIVYRLKGDFVEIVAICHGARPIESALKDDL